MNFVNYISDSLGAGTLGSKISVGVYVAIAVLMLSGLACGVKRGFSKSIIRLFTVIAAAVGSLFAVVGLTNLLVNLINAADVQTVEELILSYVPDAASQLDPMIMHAAAEIGVDTAAIFIMMFVAVVVTPILFLLIFYLLRGILFPLYALLSGLVGAINYGKNILSTVCGGVVGALQGFIIALVILIPVSGVSGIVVEAKPMLYEEAPSEELTALYDDVLDDITDNPIFELVNTYGGKMAYRKMITVTIGGEKIDMADEIIGVMKAGAHALPLLSPEFDWTDPSEDEQQAFAKLVEDLGESSLLARGGSDALRAFASCVKNGSFELPMEGANAELLEAVIEMFSTSTPYSIQGDADTVVDVYFIMCERGLLVKFTEGNTEVLHESLTQRNENGDTIIDEIIARLNEYDRAKPIVRSFTKISLGLMHESMGLNSDTEALYQDVRNDLHNVLSHSREDFASEEEYRAAVREDLNTAFAENNLDIDESVKENMLDYIAENYGDTSNISDEDIDDAILSYYQSYSKAQEESGS